ncbi:glxK Glycerate kinase [Bifidobacterium bifidum CAG:234]|nr:glxK Glycerate kinase [Bifidobacterium bifidum CAG:234]
MRLLDHDGRDVRPGGAALAEVERVDLSGLDRRLGDVHVIAACDVTNPLTGPEGASAVFGPQKGASREDVTLLDGALRHVSSVIERALAEQVPAERNGDGGKVEAAVAESSSPGHRSRPGHRTRMPIADHPGAGAAGGIGMALLAVLHADFRPGIDLVIEQSGLDAAAQWADIVFTGEGSIDAQTMFGKTPVGVASVAKRHGKPVIAIAGRVGDGIECLHGRGIDAVFGAAPGAASLDELLRDARANVARTAEQVTRLMRIVRSH